MIKGPNNRENGYVKTLSIAGKKSNNIREILTVPYKKLNSISK